MAKILIASLVDSCPHTRAGAGAYTRGIVAALRNGRNRFDVELVGPRHAPPGSWYRSDKPFRWLNPGFRNFRAKALLRRAGMSFG